MELIKKQTARITNNPVGAIIGGAALYFVSRKQVTNGWALMGLAVLGVVIGANIENGLKSKGQPTAQDVK